MPLRLEIGHTWDGEPVGGDERAEVDLWRQSDRLYIQVSAPLHHDPQPPGPPGPTWKLWEHEVVELFLLGADERYTEIEIGPWGHHLVLQLRGRRNAVHTQLPMSLRSERTDKRWTAAASLPMSLLPSPVLALNAYAIHGQGAQRRYLAWAPVPGDQPDFHRLQCFRPPPSGWPPER